MMMAKKFSIVKGAPLPDRQSRLRERGGGKTIGQVDGPGEEGRRLLFWHLGLGRCWLQERGGQVV